MAPSANLHLAAARLESQAGRMSASLSRVAAAAGPWVWRGPAAVHFADAVALHSRRVNRAAEELRQVAAQLRRQAAAAATAAAAAAPAVAAGQSPSGPNIAGTTGWGRTRSWAA